jgi:histidinol-phosphate aminotransferase
MLRPKPYIEELVPALHGGIDYEELKNLGIAPEKVLDFSVCTNPFGPPPGIAEAISEAPIDRYPDGEAIELNLLLANELGLKSDNIIIGSGSTELIRLAASVYLGSGDSVLIPQPTYAEYETACQLVGARVIRLPIYPDSDFRLNTSELVAMIGKYHPRLIFICNPNNPTGQYLNEEEIRQILSAAQKSLVVLDEAYIRFTDNPWNSVSLIGQNNLVILRSMTKDYALAGLRLGYAIAAGPIISVLKKVKPPWNVNAPAQVAGIYALQSSDYIETCCMKIKEAKKFLVEELIKLGLMPLPSRANYFLVKVGEASAIRESLLRKGILVRDCTSFGLPEYIRLAPRALPECRHLITALIEIEVKRYAS